MNTSTFEPLTIEQATELAPAIAATGPSMSVSKSYQFVSSKEILQEVMRHGWRITNASSQSRSPYAQHRVTLVHENDISTNQSQEGIPRIEMFNSHNCSKRLMFAIGFFRFVCSNGLIAATGPAETIRTKHRFSDERLSEIVAQVSQISSRFPKIINTIDSFKQRELNAEEQQMFAKYAIRGRFNYRPEVPKKFQDYKRIAELILTPRREADAGNDAWRVYNRVQENLIRGIEGVSRPIKGYSDTVRVNQLLWKGAETAVAFHSQLLQQNLDALLIKDKKKGKISS